MFKDDWAALGIEPTGDLLAIKKAYALKLRVTRPDDDADAYQRLRLAYERAQLWGRQALHAAQTAAPDTPEVVVEARREEPQKAQEAPAAPPLPAEAAPEPTIGRVELAAWIQRLTPERWDDGPKILAAWSEIRPQLVAIPLTLQTEASLRFADLVIQVRWLPIEIVEELQKRFGWLDDFRAARSLGPERQQTLHSVLEERIVRPISDPDLLQRFAPLLYLKRLRLQGKKLTALWFAARLGQPLSELRQLPDGHLLRRLGLSAEPRPLFQQQLFWGGAMRFVAVVIALLLCVLPHLLSGPQIAWGLLAICTLLGLALLHLLSMISELIRTASWHGLGLSALFGQRWFRLREHRHCATFGLVLLAGAALSSVLAGAGLPFQYVFPLWLVGLLLAWPRASAHGAMVLATTILVMLILRLPPFNASIGVQACWASLLVLGGTQLHTSGQLVPGLSPAFRSLTNSLRLCDRFGYKFALAPMLFAFALAIVVPDVRGTTVFISWVLATLGIAALQDRLTKSALGEIKLDEPQTSR